MATKKATTKKATTKKVADTKTTTKKVDVTVETGTQPTTEAAPVQAKANETFDKWWDEFGLELVRKGISDKKLVIIALQSSKNEKTYADFVDAHMDEIVALRKNARQLALLAFEF